MGHIDTCLDNLRRLIAKGDLDSLPLVERLINEYWEAVPAVGRKERLEVSSAKMFWTSAMLCSAHIAASPMR
jgi:hypothetical protein